MAELHAYTMKKYRSIAHFHTYQCSRLLGVELTCNDVSMLFISVYMPYQCKDNFELFMEYIGKISALIEESPTSNIAIVGDFNAAIDTQFDVELQELCNNLSLVISDCNYYGRNSGMFTHVSDAHGTTSWLDHVLCSQDMQTKLHSIAILDMLPSSDHVPLSFVFDFNSSPTFNDTFTCPSNKTNFNWAIATDKDLTDYKYLTRIYCKDIHVDDVVKCSDVNCKSHDHLKQIDDLYSQLCSVLKHASNDSIPASKMYTHHDYIVPGFNEFAKQLHSEARADYLLWKASGKPRAGLLYLSMCQSRIRFKRTLRECRQNEETIRANAHANSLMKKDMTSFWKGIKKDNNTKIPLAPMVDNCIGDKEICDMWQTHYKQLLNSVVTSSSKKIVQSELHSIADSSVIFCPVDIFNALKNAKTGKACGVDGLAAEHFIYADAIIHIHLSLLFNSYISHGYLPRDFMKTAIVPIIKNKAGNSSDKANYRPIALVTACSKIFESCLLIMLEKYLHTHDQQFGFKSQHATDMCIFTVKSVIKYYTKQNSTAFTCFLDAAKAFDRVSHWTLFSKMIKRNVPLVIVRIIAFWYQTQTMCVKWGKVDSEYFNVSNGVRQGGILSPKLFAIYVDDLSHELTLCKSGCYIDDQCMNHVMYADDICLMAPSAIGLQKMLDVCFDFSLRNDIMFNPVKSVCVTFKPKNSKLSCPSVRLDSNTLAYISQTKYLGFMFNTNAQDDEDMLRQMRTLYIRSNKLLRTFHYCSTDVKLELFKSYCTSFYCCYLWTAYKKSTFDRLRVAFNNAYRRVLGQPWRCSASAMYANFGINNFEATIRKSTFGFIQRLAKSTNSLIVTIEKSWSVRIDIWNFWEKTLYIATAT